MSKKRTRTLASVNFTIPEIEPLTRNQLVAFESTKHMVLCGAAGTGKTFISLYLAFDDIAKQEYDKIILVRSAVPTRDMGFLPGTDKEKAKVYEEPYYAIANEIFQRGDAYEILKKHNVVNFMTTSYLRGLTVRDSVVIVDECQNMTFHELDSIITRVGENSRIIFCGDFAQADLPKNGMKEFLQVLNEMSEFDIVEFGISDIVRSSFVKKYLIAKHSLGL
jgi:phosphate starvation-inducible protein PhoH